MRLLAHMPAGARLREARCVVKNVHHVDASLGATGKDSASDAGRPSLSSRSKNVLSIIQKLTVNLAITILFVIGAAIATIVISLSYERRLEVMYRDHLLGTVALASAMDELWKLRYGFPQFMVLGVDERRRIVAEEPQRYAAIERHLKDYSSTRRSPEERESLERLLAYLIRVTRINVLYKPPAERSATASLQRATKMCPTVYQ